MRIYVIHYLYKHTHPHALIPYLLIFLSFAIPICLTTIISFALTGNGYSPLTLLLCVMCIPSILLITCSFFRFFESLQKQVGSNGTINTIIHETSIILFLLCCILPIGFLVWAPYLLSNTGSAFFAFFLIGLAFILFFVNEQIATRDGAQTQNYFHSLIGVILVLATLFFTIFSLHSPYIIYPDITIMNAYMPNMSFHALIVFFILGTLLLIFGGYLLKLLFKYKMFQKK